MAYSNKEEPAYWVEKPLADDYSSVTDWIDVRTVNNGSFYLTWVDAAATDAVVKAQQTHDKTSDVGFDITDATYTIGAATGTGLIPIARIDSPYIRLVIVDNAESAGTVNARYFFKGAR